MLISEVGSETVLRGPPCRFRTRNSICPDVRDLSAEVAREQGARGGFRAAGRAGRDGRRASSTRCPNILAAADFKAVVRAIVDAQATRRRHRLGPRRARHQDRSRPGADRSDGARLRVGDRDQRRGDHSRLRDRARRRHVRGRRRSARARALRDGRRNRTAAERRDQRRRRRRVSASARRSTRFLATKQPQFARSERARRRGAARGFRSRSTSRSAPTSSTCTRPRRARRSARAACAISAISSSNVARLERGVYLNCGSAVVLPEVFLKAVALARNRGIALAGLTTVNLDFIGRTARRPTS